MTPLGVSAAALLALSACAAEDEPESGEEEAAAAPTGEQPSEPEPAEDENGSEDDESDSDVSPTQETSPDGDTGSPEGGLPPGGAERVADEDIDPETQGEPIETNFSNEGTEIGFNENAVDREPIEVFAEPPAASPESDTEVVAELSADDVVLLGGREIVAAMADGVWVEIELADGYGWVEDNLLEGFEGP